MRVKTIYAWSETGMDRKVNEFLEGAASEVTTLNSPRRSYSSVRW